MANPTPTFYSETLARMVQGVTSDVTLADQSGVTADSNEASEQVARDDLMLELDVTANDGDLTVKVQDSSDDSTFADVATFDSFDGGSTGTDRLAVDDLDQYVRVSYTAANMTSGADFTVKAL